MSDEVGFYVMAAPALRGLLDEFSLAIGDVEAADALHRYGTRCGFGMVEAMGITCASVAELVDNLPLLVSESGLGYGSVTEDRERIVVRLTESLEASVLEGSHVHNCNFTRGYLAGILSGTMGNRYEGEEVECKTMGGGECVFVYTSVKLEASPSSEPAKEKQDEKEGLERGILYLLEEERPQRSYEIFVKIMAAGGKGLCVSRDFPKKVRSKYDMGETQILWLSASEGEGAHDPTKLSALFYEIQVFLKTNPNSTILLSGLEYLVAQNSFLTALKFCQLLSEQAAIHDAVFLVPINPGVFDPKEFTNLQIEMTAFPS